MDITIQQGQTYINTVRWEAEPFVYKDISAITSDAPPILTVAGHGVPDGWRVAITACKGLTKLNAKNRPPRLDEYYRATYIDANTIELNSENMAGESSYTGGGILQYYTPVNITGYTARMQIRSNIDDADPILDISTTSGEIVIDDAAYTITITIPAADTALLAAGRGVFSLEVTSPGDIVTTLISGNVTITREATR